MTHNIDFANKTVEQQRSFLQNLAFDLAHNAYYDLYEVYKSGIEKSGFRAELKTKISNYVDSITRKYDSQFLRYFTNIIVSSSLETVRYTMPVGSYVKYGDPDDAMIGLSGNLSNTFDESDIFSLITDDDVNLLQDGTFVNNIKKTFSKIITIIKQFNRKLTRTRKIKPEEDKSAVLGQYAFGDIRRLPEEDNDIEKKLFNAIEDHVNSNQMMSEEDAQVFIKILKSHLYKKIIKEQTKSVYRGIIANEETLRKLLSVKQDFEIKDKGTLDVNTNVKPKYGYASSWSVDKKTSERFSKYTMSKETVKLVKSKEKMYSILLTALPQDNEGKFLDLAPMYKQFRDSVITSYKEENETIALGPINISVVTWEILTLYNDDNS